MAISLITFIAPVLVSLLVASGCSFVPKSLNDQNSTEGVYNVLLAGDFSYGDTYKQGKEMNEKYGYDYSFIGVAPFLKAANFSIVNLETPITETDCIQYLRLKRWVHRGRTDIYQEYMKKHRIDAVSLGNNHTMDCGADGLLETMDTLDRNSIIRFGAGSNAREAAMPLVRDIAIGKDHVKLAVFSAYENDGQRRQHGIVADNCAGRSAWRESTCV